MSQTTHSSDREEAKSPRRIIGDYTYQLGYNRPDLYEKYRYQAEGWIEQLVTSERERARQELLDEILKPEHRATTWIDTKGIEVVSVSIIEKQRQSLIETKEK